MDWGRERLKERREEKKRRGREKERGSGSGSGGSGVARKEMLQLVWLEYRGAALFI